MATSRSSVLSKEYVRVQVEARESGTVVNPTTLPVEMAFIADNAVEPVSADWKTASWETDSSIYYARILIGPGSSVVLKRGVYAVWVKISDNPEIPARRVGTHVVF